MPGKLTEQKEQSKDLKRIELTRLPYQTSLRQNLIQLTFLLLPNQIQKQNLEDFRKLMQLSQTLVGNISLKTWHQKGISKTFPCFFQMKGEHTSIGGEGERALSKGACETG